MKRTKEIAIVLMIIMLTTVIGAFNNVQATGKKEKLPMDEVVSIGNLLNNGANGIVNSLYDDVEDMDLYFITYDMFSVVTNQEEIDYLAEQGMSNEHIGIEKLSSSVIKNWYKWITGKELSDKKLHSDLADREGCKYFEKYDAYYVNRSDAYTPEVIVQEGIIDENGNYIIKYNNSYAITLKKTRTSYQVISNKRASEVDFSVEEENKETEKETTTEETNEADDTKKDEQSDETKATGKLPQTGKNTVIISAIAIIAIGGIAAFIGYQKTKIK